jgi:transcriptional regulator with XRE-family HTH domain
MPGTKRRPAPATLDREDNGLVKPPDPLAVCRTIRALREQAGLTQADLARKLRIPQSYIHRWEQNRVPRLDDLYRVEVDGFGLRPGSILIETGFCLPPSTTEEALANDVRLSPTKRRIVTAAYQAAVE